MGFDPKHRGMRAGRGVMPEGGESELAGETRGVDTRLGVRQRYSATNVGKGVSIIRFLDDQRNSCSRLAVRRIVLLIAEAVDSH